MALKARRSPKAQVTSGHLLSSPKGSKKALLKDAVRKWASDFASIRAAADKSGIDYSRLRHSLSTNAFYIDDLERLARAVDRPIEILRAQFEFETRIGKRGARRISAGATSRSDPGAVGASLSEACDPIRRTTRSLRGPARMLRAHFDDLWRLLGGTSVVIIVANGTELPEEWGEASPRAAHRRSQICNALSQGATLLYLWPGPEEHARNAAAGVAGLATEVFETRFREFRAAVSSRSGSVGVLLGLPSACACSLPGMRAVIVSRQGISASRNHCGFVEIPCEGVGDRELVLPISSGASESIFRQTRLAVALAIENQPREGSPTEDAPRLQEVYEVQLQPTSAIGWEPV